MNKAIIFLISLLITSVSFAQQLPGALGNLNLNTGGKQDSIPFVHRDDAKDSITISYKFLDSTRSVSLDNSINDFYTYFSIPSTLQFLGNDGSAAYSLVFTPLLKPDGTMVFINSMHIVIH
ncbi:MAG: hypothetical protein WDM71_00370 [Ferruginibacter sp.]